MIGSANEELLNYTNYELRRLSCPTSIFPKASPASAPDSFFVPRPQSRCASWRDILLHEPNSLTPGERELIATYVSSRNCTTFCALSHGAAAASHLGDASIVEKVKSDFLDAPISPKLKALLMIAGKVQQDGKLVTEADVQAARTLGATDMEIHDTVLIAAAFSMYNRYVDGLGTVAAHRSRRCTRRWASTSPKKATRSPRSGSR